MPLCYILFILLYFYIRSLWWRLRW